MRDLTFKKTTICSAFRKSGLFPFNPSMVLERVQEFVTPEQSLQSENEEDELYFEMDFNNMSTPYSPHTYDVCSSYINKKLTQNIEAGLSLSPTTARLIEKREKASRTLKLSDQLAIEELYKKKQAELDRTQHNGERHVQQFGTILVGDARLRTLVQNEEEKAQIEAIRVRKKESKRKKQEYTDGVASRKAERLRKKAEKEAQKAARRAQLAQLIVDNS